MGNGLFLSFYVIALYLGFLIPIPSTIAAWILAWREKVIRRDSACPKKWRRTMSQVGLLLCTTGVALWVYVAVANGGAVWTMNVGILGSLIAITVSAFSEGRLRISLLISSVGSLFFFGCFGAGEAI